MVEMLESVEDLEERLSRPGDADAAAVVRAVAAAARPLAESALPVVVISTRTSRAALARLLTPHIPGCAVLAYDELVRGIEVDRTGEAELTEEGTEVAA